MIQSESRTWPAVVAKAKTVTRRNWKPKTAAWYQRGRVFDMYDTAVFHHGRKIAEARCTSTAYQEPLRDMPDSDWEAEGFKWMHEHPLAIPDAAKSYIWAQDNCAFESFVRWREAFADTVCWVCQFEIVSIEDWAVTKLANIFLSDGALKP